MKLGTGAAGPWEDRSAAVRQVHPNPAAHGGWLNDTYSVQIFKHPKHPGIDHLCVRRHDGGADIPWADLQRIKDRIADAGATRWAVEVFPPTAAIVDNCNLRHVWVMPLDWSPPVDLNDPEVRV